VNYFRFKKILFFRRKKRYKPAQQLGKITSHRMEKEANRNNFQVQNSAAAPPLSWPSQNQPRRKKFMRRKLNGSRPENFAENFPPSGERHGWNF
jgi:hypothetical protein